MVQPRSPAAVASTAEPTAPAALALAHGPEPGLALTVIAFVLTHLLLRSRVGYFWQAIREDEVAARSLGIDTFRYKMIAIAISSGMTAPAGAFYAFYYNNLFPEQTFFILRSIEIILGPIIGGIGTLFGPIIGAFLITGLAEILDAFMYGAGLLELGQFDSSVEAVTADDILELAREIRRRGRRVIVFKAGKTSRGAEAARSHTAALAGDYAVARGLLEDAGVVVAHTLDMFEDYVKGLVAGAPTLQKRFLESAAAAAPNDARIRMALWSVYSSIGEHERALAAASAVPATSRYARRARFAIVQSLIELKRLDGAFNEQHILATTQAIVEYRAAQGITGPLFLGRDTHALSEPAWTTALEVLVAGGVEVVVDARDRYTPTPAVSHAILQHNAGTGPRADGIVVTPSHNPPRDGGFKYNPPHGGPADTDATSVIAARANELLAGGIDGVRRVPATRAT